MKKSELRQIIQEEIRKVFSEDNINRDIEDAFKKAVGFESPQGEYGNKMKTLKLEELPNYNKLAPTEEDVETSSMKVFMYPHIRIEGFGSVFSKEGAKELKKDIKENWTNNEEPLFTYQMKTLSKDEYSNDVTFAKLVNGKKQPSAGPGSKADLSGFYGPGAPRYSGD